MVEKSIEERVVEVVVLQLGVTREEVTLEASFIDNLGADSLDTVELMMAFENEFGLEDIPDEEAEKITTVREAIEYIEYIKKAKGVSESEPCTPNIADCSPECALRRPRN